MGACYTLTYSPAIKDKTKPAAWLFHSQVTFARILSHYLFHHWTVILQRALTINHSSILGVHTFQVYGQDTAVHDMNFSLEQVSSNTHSAHAFSSDVSQDPSQFSFRHPLLLLRKVISPDRHSSRAAEDEPLFLHSV